ncbi:MAG: DGPFAETKE family protein [Puniceicoccaceae bacterium 5H]|nr:MAG: DGPFAETKE family protein [Puniceicoccaceae bacterium 5H]
MADFTPPSNDGDYLLFIRNNAWDNARSPEELQIALERIFGWFDELTAKGIMKGGNPLYVPGKVISQSGAEPVVDGPFAESKEAIAGYIRLDVESMEAAAALAREAPHLDYGMTLEIRQISPTSLELGRLQQLAAHA